VKLSPTQAFMLQTLEDNFNWTDIFGGKRGAAGTYWSLVRRGLIYNGQLTGAGRRALKQFLGSDKRRAHVGINTERD